MNEWMDEWIEVASEKNWFNKKYINFQGTLTHNALGNWVWFSPKLDQSMFRQRWEKVI